MTASPIDLAAFRDLQETAGRDFVRELLATFLEEAPGMFADLEGGLAAREADRFRRAAHSLKSNSLSFGAVALGGLARELELAGVEAVAGRGGDPLAVLREEFARTAAALSELADA